MGDINIRSSEPIVIVQSESSSNTTANPSSSSSIRLELLSTSKCFGGQQQIYRHQSKEVGSPMKFSVFVPERRNDDEKFHVVFFLCGIMCNEQNFLFKTGFQKYASEQRLIIVGADTSPRECNIPGERDSIFVGRSAGWYLDATEEPWSTNYRMYSYISKELPDIIKSNFPTTGRIGLCGHSMGGNGTVVIGLRNPETFHCLSLLAPSCNPTSWGRDMIFKKLLGDNEETWADYDASVVTKKYDGPFREILLDQGSEDEYLQYLLPKKLVESATENPKGKDVLSVQLRMQDGYDHSYYFVASFIEDHFKHHANILNQL